MVIELLFIPFSIPQEGVKTMHDSTTLLNEIQKYIHTSHETMQIIEICVVQHAGPKN
jgi:hypothetical protein